MKHLHSGEFFGDTTRTMLLDGITLTDTVYTHEKVDWHYHENAYFTFILQGFMTEGSKKGVLHCPAGTLLFHNWQESHYNIKPPVYTRGFHVEIKRSWFEKFSFSANAPEGSFNISDPYLKILFHALYKEAGYPGGSYTLPVESMLLQVLDNIFNGQVPQRPGYPCWVNKGRELLHDTPHQQLNLAYIAKELGIHPVHLSRDFARYFNCSFGEYIRKIRIEKALTMINNKNINFSDIVFECGFADQSHFIRSFKTITNTTPLQYRKQLSVLEKAVQ